MRRAALAGPCSAVARQARHCAHRPLCHHACGRLAPAAVVLLRRRVGRHSGCVRVGRRGLKHAYSCQDRWQAAQQRLFAIFPVRSCRPCHLCPACRHVWRAAAHRPHAGASRVGPPCGLPSCLLCASAAGRLDVAAVGGGSQPSSLAAAPHGVAAHVVALPAPGGHRLWRRRVCKGAAAPPGLRAAVPNGGAAGRLVSGATWAGRMAGAVQGWSHNSQQAGWRLLCLPGFQMSLHDLLRDCYAAPTLPS